MSIKHSGTALDDTLPDPRRTFSVVLSVDSAYHFDPRTTFLRQAHALLEPGGRLVLTDIVRADGATSTAFGAWMMEHAFDYLDAPPARVTGKDVPMPYAANLEKLALPTVDDIVAAAKGVLYR